MSVPEQGRCCVTKQNKKSSFQTFQRTCLDASFFTAQRCVAVVDGSHGVADGNHAVAGLQLWSQHKTSFLRSYWNLRSAPQNTTIALSRGSFWAGLRRGGGFHSTRGRRIMKRKTTNSINKQLVWWQQNNYYPKTQQTNCSLNKTNFSNSLQQCHYGWTACQTDFKTAIVRVENVFDLSSQQQLEGQQWRECYHIDILESSTFGGRQTLHFHGIKKHSGNLKNKQTKKTFLTGADWETSSAGFRVQYAPGLLKC